jgi:O-antigen/teichoic acid export membrane protein
LRRPRLQGFRLSRLIHRLRGRLEGSDLLGFGRDASYVAVWQGASALADLAQIALLTRILGISEYGRFALAVALVVLIGQFFDFRVGVVATTVGAQELRVDRRRAAGAFQVSYFLDAVTGVVGFLVVLAAGIFIAPGLVGDDGVAIVAVYAIALLASTTDEASLSVLRLLDRYRLVAVYTAALELLRVSLVAIALVVSPSLLAVAGALALHRVLLGVANAWAAARAFRAHSGLPLFGGRRFLLVRDRWREMLKIIFSTNVVSYVRLAQTQLPTLLLGVLINPFQVGLYKIGTAGALLVAKLADPPRVAFLPRISHMWSARDLSAARALVIRLARIALPAVAVVGGLLILLRTPVLHLLGGSAAGSADLVLIIATIGFTVNTALFWNEGVLYAAGRVSDVAKLSLVTAIVQVGLLVPLVQVLEATGAALALASSLLFANAVATWWAVRELSATQGLPLQNSS